jgi:hypothetical protein
MAGGGRFHIGTEAELVAIIDEKDSASTKNLQNRRLSVLLIFLLESGRGSIDCLDFSIEELDSALKDFYFAARKTDGSLFKKTTLQNIQYGLKRFFQGKKEVYTF